MKQTNANEKVIIYAAELLRNGANVETLKKYGHDFRVIRYENETTKQNGYVCLCLSDFAAAVELINKDAAAAEYYGEIITDARETADYSAPVVTGNNLAKVIKETRRIMELSRRADSVSKYVVFRRAGNCLAFGQTWNDPSTGKTRRVNDRITW